MRCSTRVEYERTVTILEAWLREYAGAACLDDEQDRATLAHAMVGHGLIDPKGLAWDWNERTRVAVGDEDPGER